MHDRSPSPDQPSTDSLAASRPPQSPSEPPTLVVFTLGPRVEARRRQLLGPAGSSVESMLYRCQLDHLLAAGRANGMRLAVASPQATSDGADVLDIRQPNGDFGERLAGSLRAACHRRATPWIVVGIDSPGLDTETLRRVSQLLAQSPERIVVGPSNDGGVYLIAGNQDLGSLLARVSWGHRRTGESLRRLLAAEGLETVDLSPLDDLDRRADLERWLRLRPGGSVKTGSSLSPIGTWSWLIAELGRLLAAAPGLFAPPYRAPQRLFAAAPTGRAPPS